ncbi:MAG: hypothetical protein P1V51_20655 [Deltaproteobacteria bacterium]|nr:hypothetical protein [Deltaproteobacteria bacterium]
MEETPRGRALPLALGVLLLGALPARADAPAEVHPMVRHARAPLGVPYHPGD